MLTLRQLEDLPISVVEIMADAEQTIINEMARRISRQGMISPATNHQLSRLEEIGAMQDTIVRELSKATRLTEQQIWNLFDEAATRTLNSDNAVYKVRGYKPIPLADNPWLQQIVRAGMAQTSNEFANLTQTTANTATRQFERALDLATMQISTGAMDYQTAIKNAIRELTSQGMASIRYGSGRVDHLGVAARRAILTGVNQMAGELQLANMQMMGTDLVETTAHFGARPDHEVWQGQVFSVSGTHPKYPDFRSSTGYGTGPGLLGWNCRHSFFPFFEGLSEKAYPEERLREFGIAYVELNGSKMSLYDATQYQRNIERSIRRWKREASALEAAGLDNTKARSKIREWQARQRDFIDQTGLRRDYFRERGGNQLSGGATSGTMIMSNKEVREWYTSTVANVRDSVDPTLPLQEQAQQVFNARNAIKTQARSLMMDDVERNRLATEKPPPTFEWLVQNKMSRKGLTREQALQDILGTAGKTNVDVDRRFMIER